MLARTSPRIAAAALCALYALSALPVALAQGQDGNKPMSGSGGGIYTCVDAQGRRQTADRPIPECAAKEQRELNADGSLKKVHPPSLTAEERAERDQRERRLAEERNALADAGRRDRNLVKRFPNEASHQRAREAALDTVRLATRASEFRLRELANERKPLLSEAEFYQGRLLPPKLKQQLDANDASVDAQRSASANQDAELGRVTRLYDTELDRLRRLWAGAAPGSMGPLAAPGSKAAGVAPSPGTKTPAR